MTWNDFITVYSLVAALLVLVLWRWLFTSAIRACRYFTFSLALGFFLDQAGESRGLWSFDDPAVTPLLDVSLQNLAFALATAIYVILWYRLGDLFHRRRSNR